ncbi:zinc finger matrin-type protein 5-like [Mizuhopecten yessoensis]|uniref:Zinc finger matrin-type protein 5 n=1 Tax=Mizuhopecten yessoensis TaxID=6573 RepID=A0A210PLJ1_MIZYE|nr:zinc finger matrin-type protein 5-like [Mizuhopecten yessoensis]XP_021339070.1 zinc finger matrin-type protein 5-like [Mizuhopecten yessoensis]OWF37296.1 Zinc finger matrin-type protein 5 [Mizuhopecten yessoensis]
MGKNYYCDFCDKTFADKANNRKNHLKGLIHQRCRKAYYDQYREPGVILAEELSKRPCKHFLSSGHCSFMGSCKYSHMTDEQKQEMQRQIDAKKNVASSKTAESIEPPSLEKWLEKVQKCSKDKTKVDKIHKEQELPVYSLPPHLEGITNLPPSLLPPPPGIFTSLPLEEWG